jgi:hypothetical protein
MYKQPHHLQLEALQLEQWPKEVVVMVALQAAEYQVPGSAQVLAVPRKEALPVKDKMVSVRFKHFKHSHNE